MYHIVEQYSTKTKSAGLSRAPYIQQQRYITVTRRPVEQQVYASIAAPYSPKMPQLFAQSLASSYQLSGP